MLPLKRNGSCGITAITDLRMEQVVDCGYIHMYSSSIREIILHRNLMQVHITHCIHKE